MANSKLVLVAGVTGQQGGAVARSLIEKGHRVRGLTRNVDGAAAQAVAALGVELVKGDFGDPASLAAAVADMNGDGHLDVVTANAGEPNAIYFGDGRGRFDDGRLFGRDDGQSFSVAVADLDLDGDQDIVIGNVGMQNAVFYNDGSGESFVEARFGGDADVTYWIVLGDVTGDGYPDIGEANTDGLNGVYISRPRPPR